MSTPKGYSGVQIALHWLVAILIVAAYLTSDAMEKIAEARFDEGVMPDGLPAHAAMGIAVFLLVIVRLIVRLQRGAPEPPADDPEALRSAARWGHRLLYVLMIGAPIGGMAIWFGGIESLGDGHGAAATFLVILASGHAIMALWHHFVRKDGLLGRMTRPGD